MAGLLGSLSGQVRLDVRQAVAAYATLRAQHTRTIYALRGTGDAFVGVGQNMVAAGAVGAYAFYRMAKAAAEFERKMDFYGAVTDASKKDMQELSKFTLQLAQDTVYSANEIADGIIELGKAGVPTRKIINGIGEAMANLGAAGDIPLMESGQIITSTIQQFDMSARDAVRVTDLLAGAANASIADITDLGVSLKYAGGVANAAGLDFEDTITAISLLAKAGIRGSTAGTSLRQMMVSFGGATGPATEALEKLNIITEDGTNKFFTQEGKLKDLSKVFQILQDHTADLSQKQRLMHLRTIFNNRALSAASILTRDGAEGFKEMRKEMQKTTAAEVAAERLDNLSGDIEILKGNIETFMIQAGTPFQEFLRDIVQGLTKLVQKFGELDPETQKMILQFAAIVTGALLLMGTFSLIIGIFFRFIVSILRVIEGLAFLKRALRIGGSFKGFVKGAGIIGAVATAIWGVVEAMDWLASKNKTVDRFWGSWKEGYEEMGQVGGFKAVLEEMWEFGNERSEGKLDKIVENFKKLPDDIGKALKDLPDTIRYAIDEAPRAFKWVREESARHLKKLPGIVKRFAEDAKDKFLEALEGLDEKAETIFRLVREEAETQLTKLRDKAAEKAGETSDGFLTNLRGLPNQTAYIFSNVSGRAGKAIIGLVLKSATIAQKVKGRFLGILNELIPRATSIATRMKNGFVTRAGGMISGAAQTARDTVDQTIGSLLSLPSRSRGIAAETVIGFIGRMRTLPSRAMDIAGDVFSYIVNVWDGLPTVIGGILGRMVDAFLGQMRSAYDAARGLADSLWRGFKDGIGMHSPTYFERAMWQITGTIDEETRHMARQVLKVQKLGKEMERTPLRIGDLDASQGIKEYARLASLQASNEKRARTLAAASSRLPRDDARRNRRGANRRRDFTITNWREGRGYMREIAQDAIDDDHDYDDSLGGM